MRIVSVNVAMPREVVWKCMTAPDGNVQGACGRFGED